MTYTHIDFTVEITIHILTDTEFKKKMMLAIHSGSGPENNKSPYQKNLSNQKIEFHRWFWAFPPLSVDLY